MRRLDVEHKSVTKAATWVRDQYNIPDNQSIINLFEQEFNCRLIISKRTGKVTTITFPDNETYTWFLLKWT